MRLGTVNRPPTSAPITNALDAITPKISDSMMMMPPRAEKAR
jgi:hypothetical protein